jgi:NitT/TauT family transport system ATP-binding protein
LSTVLELAQTPGEVHAVRVEGLTVTFPHDDRLLVALQHATLEVKRGELVCVVGASGSGKSTLLNVLAGLERPTRGRADVHGRVALMFQEAALLPWLTAAGNVELALELRGIKRTDRKRRAYELLHRVHLEGFESRRPHELSGGMKQRVALARALAQDADVLLMDEPFAALDAITRDLLHEELERLWSQSGLTILFVTHNAREAVRLGDRVLVFTSRPGRVGHEITVDLPRPRSLDSPELAVIAGRITDRLKQEMRLHG